MIRILSPRSILDEKWERKAAEEDVKPLTSPKDELVADSTSRELIWEIDSSGWMSCEKFVDAMVVIVTTCGAQFYIGQNKAKDLALS